MAPDLLSIPLCMTELPRAGWFNDGIVDNGSDDMRLCPWCGRQHYRYGHVMKHPEVTGQIEVGCVCAERIAADYDGGAAERRFKAEQLKIRNGEQFESMVMDPARWHNSCAHFFGVRVDVVPSKFPNGGWRVDINDMKGNCYLRSNVQVIAAIRTALQQLGVIL